MLIRRFSTLFIVLALLFGLVVYTQTILADPSPEPGQTQVEGPYQAAKIRLQQTLTPTLALLGPTWETPYDEPVTLEVYLNQAENVGGFEFDLRYDPALVSVANLNGNGFLGETLNCDPTTGRCLLKLGPTTGPTPTPLGGGTLMLPGQSHRTALGAYTYGSRVGATGEGVIAQIELLPLGVAGTTPLTIANVIVVDVQGNRLQTLDLQHSSLTLAAPEGLPATPTSTATRAPTNTPTPLPTNTPVPTTTVTATPIVTGTATPIVTGTVTPQPGNPTIYLPLILKNSGVVSRTQTIESNPVQSNTLILPPAPAGPGQVSPNQAAPATGNDTPDNSGPLALSLILISSLALLSLTWLAFNARATLSSTQPRRANQSQQFNTRLISFMRWLFGRKGLYQKVYPLFAWTVILLMVSETLYPAMLLTVQAATTSLTSVTSSSETTGLTTETNLEAKTGQPTLPPNRPWTPAELAMAEIPVEDGGPSREIPDIYEETPIGGQVEAKMATLAPSKEIAAEDVEIYVYDYGFSDKYNYAVADTQILWHNTSFTTHTLQNMAVCPVAGDYGGVFGECDNVVDGTDMQLMRLRWRTTSASSNYHPAYDFFYDDNARVNVIDLQRHTHYLGDTEATLLTAWAGAEVVPESSTNHTFSQAGTFAYYNPDYPKMRGAVEILPDLGARHVRIHSGLMQNGAVGQPLPRPFVAYVTNVNNEPVGNMPVVFEVVAGEGSLTTNVTTIEDEGDRLVGYTDSQGYISVTLTMGTYPGRNAVSAYIPGNMNDAIIFPAQGVETGEGPTTFKGIIRDAEALVPLEGVTLVINEVGDDTHTALAQTTTDANGIFIVPDIPVTGLYILYVEPSTVLTDTAYPPLVFEVNLIEGVENSLNQTIYLPPLDIDQTTTIDHNTDTVVANENMPGVSVEVLAGSSNVDQLLINPVSPDKLPMPLPDGGSSFSDIAILPANAAFDPPAPIKFPNDTDLPPGTPLSIYSFDHDTSRFEIVAGATVSEDGLWIASNPGEGIEHGGWHGPNCPPGVCIDPTDGEGGPLGPSSGGPGPGPGGGGPGPGPGPNPPPPPNENGDPPPPGGGPGPGPGGGGPGPGPSDDEGGENPPDPNGGDPNGGDPNGGDPNGGDPNGGDPNGGEEGDTTGGCGNSCSNENGGIGPSDENNQGPSQGGDPLNLHDGQFTMQVTDMTLPGRGFNFSLMRSYRSGLNYDGPLGYNWDFSYNRTLVELESGDVIFYRGRNRGDTYELALNGEYASAWGFFDRLKKQADGTFTLTSPEGFVQTFAPRGAEMGYEGCTAMTVNGLSALLNFDGSYSIANITAINDFQVTIDCTLRQPRPMYSLVSMQDRYGNEMTFHYNGEGHLIRVNDTLDRNIFFTWYPSGRLYRVTDFANRHWTYTYDANGDLTAVTGPPVTGTPNGNDFPEGKTERYAYSSGFADPRLNHNLLTITDPKGQVYVENVYDNDINSPTIDYVVEQTWGEGTLSYQYERINLGVTSSNLLVPVQKTTEIDRNGNKVEYFHNIFGNRIAERHYTNRDVNPNQPAFYETRHIYNYEGLLLRTVFPRGNNIKYIYDYGNPNRQQRSNLIEMRYYDGPLGDAPPLITTYTYEPEYNYVKTVTSPRGHHPDYGPPEDYMTTYYYDYEEATLGDLNGDGRTDQAVGQVVKVVYPSATLPDGTTQAVETTATYNDLGQVLSQTDAEGNVTTFDYYASSGIPGDPTDRESFLQRVTYDAGTGTDPNTGQPYANLTAEWTYNLLGAVTSQTDPKGNTSTYVLNSLNQVVEAVSAAPFHYQTRFTYDENNKVSQIDVQNVLGNGAIDLTNPWLTSQFSYNIMDDLVQSVVEVDPATNLTTTYQYDGNQNVVQTIRPGGEIATVTYDERNLPYQANVAVGTPDEVTYTTLYDKNGNVSQVLDATGDATTYSYDGFDRTIKVVDALGNEAQSVYDPDSNVLETVAIGPLNGTDPTPVTLAQANYMYDELGRRIEAQAMHFEQPGDPMTPVVTRWTYDAKGNLLLVEDDLGRTSQFSYDGLNRLLAVTDPVGNQAEYVYDANSNLVQLLEYEVNPEGQVPAETFTTNLNYDSLNRTTRVIDNIGNTSTYAYDSRGNLTAMVDGEGNTMRYRYDGLSRKIAEENDLRVDGTGATEVTEVVTSSYTYDANSRLVQITDDNGNSTSYQYDNRDNMLTATYADGTSRSYTYNDDNNLLTWSDANGNQVNNSYDPLNRLTQVNVTRGPGILGTSYERYEYDGLSRTTLAEDDDTVVTFSYDSLSRVLSEDQNGLVVASAYDSLGNRLGVTYPGGTALNYTYDNNDRLKAIKAGNTTLANHTYLGNRLLERTFNNNTQQAYTYDADRRLTELRHTTTADVLIAGFQYGYNKVDMRTYEAREHKNGAGDAYTYDSLYRVVDVAYGLTDPATGSGTPARQTSYVYDGVGNRQQVLEDGLATNYVVNEVNEYTTVGGEALTYDDNGNLTDDGEQTYAYDYKNRLVRVTATGLNATYQYDALGRRLSKVVNGATETYVYDRARLIEERDSNGTVIAHYVYGLGTDDLLQMTRNGQTYSYHRNALGSIVALTNGSGNLVERYEYDAYGDVTILAPNGTERTVSAVGNPYAFTGRRFDAESGLYNYRNRYYDADLGRFISRDPAGYTDGLNLYQYARSNPVNMIDPTGLGSKKSGKGDFKGGFDGYLKRVDSPKLTTGFIQPVNHPNNSHLGITIQGENGYIGEAQLSEAPASMPPNNGTMREESGLPPVRRNGDKDLDDGCLQSTACAFVRMDPPDYIYIDAALGLGEFSKGVRFTIGTHDGRPFIAESTGAGLGVGVIPFGSFGAGGGWILNSDPDRAGLVNEATPGEGAGGCIQAIFSMCYSHPIGSNGLDSVEYGISTDFGIGVGGGTGVDIMKTTPFVCDGSLEMAPDCDPNKTTGEILKEYVDDVRNMPNNIRGIRDDIRTRIDRHFNPEPSP